MATLAAFLRMLDLIGNRTACECVALRGCSV